MTEYLLISAALGYILSAFIGYTLGSLNLAYFISKARGFDIRTYGSNNAGASNATVTMGLKIGLLVGIHDILKAFLAVTVTSWLCPSLVGASVVAGACVVLGHIFPFYLNFKGGKGFASYVGMMLGIDWRFGIALIVISVLITLASDYIIFGTFTTILVSPIHLIINGYSLLSIIAIIIASLLILSKHLINIKRVIMGEEIGLRRALSKEDKIGKGR